MSEWLEEEMIILSTPGKRVSQLRPHPKTTGKIKLSLLTCVTEENAPERASFYLTWRILKLL